MPTFVRWLIFCARSGSGDGGVEDFCYEGRLNTAFDNHSKAVDEDDRSSATAKNANANSKAQP
jgi:hypothetical protein